MCGFGLQRAYEFSGHNSAAATESNEQPLELYHKPLHVRLRRALARYRAVCLARNQMR